MKTLLSIFLLLAIAFTLSFCNKTETKPLAASVSFRVDSLTDLTFSDVQGVWDANTSLMSLTAKNETVFTLSLSMPNGLQGGVFFFSTSTISAAAFQPDFSMVPPPSYLSYADTKSFGSIAITDVTSDSVVTGTFNFTLKDPVSDKIIKLSNGVVSNVKMVNRKSNLGGNGDFFTAKIDDVLWSPAPPTGSISFGKLVISTSDSTKYMGLSLPPNITVGNYPMDDIIRIYTGFYRPTPFAVNRTFFVPSRATSKLTITEHNTTTKQIKGTFNFRGEDAGGLSRKFYLITEGAFSVKY